MCWLTLSASRNICFSFPGQRNLERVIHVFLFSCHRNIKQGVEVILTEDDKRKICMRVQTVLFPSFFGKYIRKWKGTPFSFTQKEGNMFSLFYLCADKTIFYRLSLSFMAYLAHACKHIFFAFFSLGFAVFFPFLFAHLSHFARLPIEMENDMGRK